MRTIHFKLDVHTEVPDGASIEETVQAIKDFLADDDRDPLFIGQVSHSAEGDDDGDAIEVLSVSLIEGSVTEGDELQDATEGEPPVDHSFSE